MPKITPFLWIEKDAKGAAKFYASVFKNSKIKSVTKLKSTPSGVVELAVVELCGVQFTLMAAGPLYKFNESVSFVISCKTQREVDYYWKKLSADPNAEACGWLKDKYGLSWQVTPTILPKMLADKDPAKVAKVTKAFLQMKRFDIAALKRAYSGK